MEPQAGSTRSFRGCKIKCAKAAGKRHWQGPRKGKRGACFTSRVLSVLSVSLSALKELFCGVFPT